MNELVTSEQQNTQRPSPPDSAKSLMSLIGFASIVLPVWAVWAVINGIMVAALGSSRFTTGASILLAIGIIGYTLWYVATKMDDVLILIVAALRRVVAQAKGEGSVDDETVVQRVRSFVADTSRVIESSVQQPATVNVHDDHYGRMDWGDSMFNLIGSDHLAGFAGTGAGKSVFITALMQHVIRNHGGGYFVVDCKPDDFAYGKWPGALRRAKGDTPEAEEVFTLFESILKKRRDNSDNVYKPLFLVVDEIAALEPDIVPRLAAISERGRSMNIWLALTSQTASVRRTNWEGLTTTLRANFTLFTLRKDDEGERLWAVARLAGGIISPSGPEQAVPSLPHFWDDKSGRVPVSLEDEMNAYSVVTPVTETPSVDVHSRVDTIDSASVTRDRLLTPEHIRKALDAVQRIPDKEEALRMIVGFNNKHRAGMSKRAIAESVFGYVNGRSVAKVTEVMDSVDA